MNHAQFPNRFACKMSITAGLMLCSVFLAGCGSDGTDSGKVTGGATVTITNGGSPVTGGRVDFTTDRPGEGGGGELDQSGSVTIPNLPVGEYTVIVVPPVVVQVPGVEPTEAPEPSSIPEKFQKMTTSPLKAKVEQGSNHFEFDLSETEAS